MTETSTQTSPCKIRVLQCSPDFRFGHIYPLATERYVSERYASPHHPPHHSAVHAHCPSQRKRFKNKSEKHSKEAVVKLDAGLKIKWEIWKNATQLRVRANPMLNGTSHTHVHARTHHTYTSVTTQPQPTACIRPKRSAVTSQRKPSIQGRIHPAIHIKFWSTQSFNEPIMQHPSAICSLALYEPMPLTQ